MEKEVKKKIKKSELLERIAALETLVKELDKSAKSDDTTDLENLTDRVDDIENDSNGHDNRLNSLEGCLKSIGQTIMADY